MSQNPKKSGTDQDDDKRERPGGRLVVGIVLGLALLVGGGYAAAYYAAGDKVPRGTTIEGISVGGKTPADAAAALQDALSARDSAKISVAVGKKTAELVPARSGLSVDYAASVAEAGGGRTWNPSRLWDYYTGGDDLDAVVDIDQSRLDAALAEAAAPAESAPRDGAVDLSKGRVQETKARVGQSVDTAAAREAVIAAYLSEPKDTATLPLIDVAPEIDDKDVRTAVDGFANPALSGPVTLMFDKSPIKLTPRQFAPALSLEPVDGRLEARVDQAELTTLVESATSNAGAPLDATVAIVDGKPKVIPAKPGVTFEPDAVAATFLDLVTRPEGDRVVEVEAVVDQADFTTKDARALKIREQVSSFSTFFPYAEYRNINIGRAAELVNGTVLKPGEIFSMNDIVGERTRENGFTEGFIISDGIFKEDLGGGVSQLATTLFNGMFFAGLKDIEHKPHSLYIDRYPVGREATVAFGALDMRFENDTPYGVLVQASVAPASPGGQGELNVSMYSTKIWDITTDESPRRNFTEPGSRTLKTPGCTPNTGYGGFTIDVFRYFRKAGQSVLERTEKFTTVYKPSDTVICKEP